jgi:hypothetical protein
VGIDPELPTTGGIDGLGDFSACKIARKQDWIDLYATPYYFGTEADDRMNATVFWKGDPFGASDYPRLLAPAQVANTGADPVPGRRPEAGTKSSPERTKFATARARMIWRTGFSASAAIGIGDILEEHGRPPLRHEPGLDLGHFEGRRDRRLDPRQPPALFEPVDEVAQAGIRHRRYRGSARARDERGAAPPPAVGTWCRCRAGRGHPRIPILRRLSDCRRAWADPRAACRIINHALRGAIPRPASAENLQEHFSSRLNRDPSTNCLAGRRRRRLRVAIVDGFGIADVLVRVFDTVAGPSRSAADCRGRPSSLAVPAVRTRVSYTPAIVAASPGVISPHASAVVTAFVARDTFCGDGSSISRLPTAASDGSENVTGRSWRRGSTRSRHSFIANMSPASAASTALHVNPKASPSSKVAAASIALFREPRRRPAGLPDRPSWSSRLRPRAGDGPISSLTELLPASLRIPCLYTRNMSLRQ